MKILTIYEVNDLKTMKKFLAILLTLCVFILPLTLNASAGDNTRTAMPLSVGLQALRSQFKVGVADESNGYALDYCYYSPAGINDTEKYPVVIYLHGIGHGSYVGSQLEDSTMATWASAEMQARWSDTGGAFILLPRCPEDQMQYWNKNMIDPLRTLIDSFIEEHRENIDTTRIFVGGSSAGGEMTWDLAIAYPEYFAGIFPLAATGTRSAEDIIATKDISIWVFASTLDPIINYSTNTLPQWDLIRKYNSDPANCRLSSFTSVKNPDGTPGDSNHRLYTTIMYDLMTENGSSYPNVSTVNGIGLNVMIVGSNGIIRWMSNTHSSFDGTPADRTTPINVFTIMIIPFRNMLFRIANIFQRILGFV